MKEPISYESATMTLKPWLPTRQRNNAAVFPLASPTKPLMSSRAKDLPESPLQVKKSRISFSDQP